MNEYAVFFPFIISLSKKCHPSLFPKQNKFHFFQVITSKVLLILTYLSSLKLSPRLFPLSLGQS